VDVVVVGGGIAGAAAAWALARAGAEVLLVEREPGFGVHATGRSAAVLSQTSGPAAVRALAAASRPFLEDPPAGFCDHPLTGPRGLLWVADGPRSGVLRAFAADAARHAPGIEVLDPERALALAPALRPGWLALALWEPGARSIDVDGLLSGYLRGLRRLGGTAQPGEGLVSARPRGGGWAVRTDRRQVEAATVVDAAGAWADEVAGRCGVPPLHLVPYKRTAFVFAPPDGVDVTGWPLVMDIASRFYVEPDAGRLLASPAEETPCEPHDARADELDVARAVEALAEATTLVVRGVRRAWAGLRTFSADRVPVVGSDPVRPSWCWAAGQGGYGIKTAPAVGALVVAAVTGQPPGPELAGVDPAAYSPARFRAAPGPAGGHQPGPPPAGARPTPPGPPAGPDRPAAPGPAGGSPGGDTGGWRTLEGT
jgi:D-arginine dehydrogenase